MPIRASCRADLEKLLDNYEYELENIENMSELNENISNVNLVGIGRDCSKLCYLIKKHIGNDSDELIKWLARKSDIEFKIGHNTKGYRQIELKYSSYSYSGDSDKEIGEIFKRRNKKTRAIDFYNGAVKKYRKSIHFARQIEDGQVYEKNLKKGEDAAIQSIGFSFNKIAYVYVSMYDITKDDIFLEEAKLANEYSKHAFVKTNVDCPGLNIVSKKISYREDKIVG